MYEKLSLRIQGVAPLLQHNGRLANPLDPIAKAMKKVSATRKKEDYHYELLSDLEWLGSIYTTEQFDVKVEGRKVEFNPNGARICIPPDVIEGALIRAAMKVRKGDAFKSGGIVIEEPAILELRSTKTLAEMFADPGYRDMRGVRVQKNRIIRTRGRFNIWSTTVEINWLPELVSKDDVRDALVTAGRFVGLCDYRPRFGRFTVQN